MFVKTLFANFLLILQLFALTSNSKKIKRELFRENLLPQFGGKIPESAFVPERIKLNRFNQNGLHTTDNGVYFQQRYPGNIYHGTKNHLPPTLKISDNVDTTYTIREPVKNYLNYPHLTPYNQLPILPKNSLYLIRQNKYKSGRKHNCPSGQQIFYEYKPLLQKLQDANYI